jgi:hypothetical protein
MQIRLQRAFSPEEMAETECGICGVAFYAKSVMAEAVTDGRCPVEVGLVCPECLAYLGERNPERFSRILAEYHEAVQRYPEPMFSSGDEVVRLEEGAFWEAFAASKIA